jgi:hypothetical protein
MGNSNATIGNRSRDLPVCSAVPQPTAPLRAPLMKVVNLEIWFITFTDDMNADAKFRGKCSIDLKVEKMETPTGNMMIS